MLVSVSRKERPNGFVFDGTGCVRGELGARKGKNSSMTPEQQIEMGRLQRQSAKDLSRKTNSVADEVLSYGMWLGGAWLECSVSKFEPCIIAYTVMEQMVRG